MYTTTPNHTHQIQIENYLKIDFFTSPLPHKCVKPIPTVRTTTKFSNIFFITRMSGLLTHNKILFEQNQLSLNQNKLLYQNSASS